MPIRRSPNGVRHVRPQPGRDRPEWVVAINRKAWSQSVGTGGRNHPVRAVKGQCKFIYEFTESEGRLISWAAFFLIGLALVPNALKQLTLSMLAIILISLFVVRPLAIWISLTRTDASPLTRLFFGWFGPRGLATALFALLVVPKISGEMAEPILALAVNAVWISALLHGLSAAPAARWYADQLTKMGQCPEVQRLESFAKPLRSADHHGAASKRGKA
jgi:sodium/hydrogen antiporter